MKQIHVSAAIIRNGGEILCMQRGENRYSYVSRKFEFPGGKIEPGETPEEALLRELREEMDYTVEIERPFMTIEHDYPDFHITLHTFLCKASSREFNRKEHLSHCWLAPEKMTELEWAPADRPAVERLAGEWTAGEWTAGE